MRLPHLQNEPHVRGRHQAGIPVQTNLDIVAIEVYKTGTAAGWKHTLGRAELGCYLGIQKVDPPYKSIFTTKPLAEGAR